MENKISRKKNPPTKKEIELANKLRAKRLENNFYKKARTCKKLRAFLLVKGIFVCTLFAPN